MPTNNFMPSYLENCRYFDSLFGIGTNYDFVGRERQFAGHCAKFYFIDSFVTSYLSCGASSHRKRRRCGNVHRQVYSTYRGFGTA